MDAKTQEESRLASLIVEVLNLDDVDPEEIGPDQPLFADGLGLDSIDALEIAVAIAQKYDVHLKAEDESTQQIFYSVRNLAAYIEENSPA